MTTETILPRRILVVDDEKPVRDALRMMLECDGHLVETAGSGSEALSKFTLGKYDVVTTDERMDGMSGVQLAEAIKALAPRQPIIMISAHEIQQPAAVDFLVRKPFTFDSLGTALATVLKEPAPEHK